MGHQQTSSHRSGKNTYHQIGLVRGQFGDIPHEEWLAFISELGYDGWEEANHELDFSRLTDDASAEAYAKERVQLANKYNLEIFSNAAHLAGQALGDEPSAKTLTLVGGEAVDAYCEWRSEGNEPPRTDPYYVPDHVGKLVYSTALNQLISAVRLAHFLGKEQDRIIPVTGFVGSPAHCWSHWFEWPPIPSKIKDYSIPDARKVSLELLAERFSPVFEACRQYGTTFDLECHPTERAMGDLESANDYLQTMEQAGFGDVVGFNFDCSHMEWQGVSGIDFIREFEERIHSVHIKGAYVAPNYTRAGRLGGHRPMGHRYNGWNFTTPGTARDATPLEEIIVELNRIGYDGALNIEWEDNDVEKKLGAKIALENVQRADFTPSSGRHDDALQA